MSIFAIALSEPNPDAIQRIKGKHPRHYELNDASFLVEGDYLAEDVATEVGIKGENRIETAYGAVFKLNRYYSGFAAKSLWEWPERGDKKE